MQTAEGFCGKELQVSSAVSRAHRGVHSLRGGISDNQRLQEPNRAENKIAYASVG